MKTALIAFVLILTSQNTSEQSFVRTKNLVEANRSECMGATKQGLVQGINALLKAIEAGYADRVAAYRLLAEAYNTLAFGYSDPDSAGQRDASAKRLRVLKQLLALAPRDADARYEVAMAIKGNVARRSRRFRRSGRTSSWPSRVERSGARHDLWP